MTPFHSGAPNPAAATSTPSLGLRVLSDADIGRIHAATLEVLACTGTRVCDPALLPFVLETSRAAVGRWLAPLVTIGGCFLIVALAGPAWERAPQPTFRDETPMVLVLDLSASMYADDLSPDRISRVRFKLADLLKDRDAGRAGATALVVFAGEAFTVTPLTDDTDTILAMLPALEPDLMPVKISAEQVEQWRSELPELPSQRRTRYVDELGLPEYDAGVLTADKEVSDWFETAIQHTDNAKAVSNFVMGEMMRLLSEQDLTISESRVTPEILAEIIALIDAKTISIGAGKQVFEIIFKEGGDPKTIVEEKGMAQVSDDSALEDWADEAIANNPNSVAEYQGGKQGAINFLMGQVMKASKGKANPGAVMQMLKQKLDG